MFIRLLLCINLTLFLLAPVDNYAKTGDPKKDLFKPYKNLDFQMSCQLYGKNGIDLNNNVVASSEMNESCNAIVIILDYLSESEELRACIDDFLVRTKKIEVYKNEESRIKLTVSNDAVPSSDWTIPDTSCDKNSSNRITDSQIDWQLLNVLNRLTWGSNLIVFFGKSGGRSYYGSIAYVTSNKSESKYWSYFYQSYGKMVDFKVCLDENNEVVSFECRQVHRN